MREPVSKEDTLSFPSCAGGAGASGAPRGSRALVSREGSQGRVEEAKEEKEGLENKCIHSSYHLLQPLLRLRLLRLEKSKTSPDAVASILIILTTKRHALTQLPLSMVTH